MRPESVGDVELREDFDARDDPVERGHGKIHVLAQHTVHPISNRSELPARLDVDVTRPLSNRVPDDQVGQLDDRRRGRGILRDGLGAHFLDQLDRILADVVDQPTQEGVDGLLWGKAIVECVLNRPRRGDFEQGCPPCAEAQSALRLHVGRVTRRDNEVAIVFGDREYVVLPCHRLWNQQRGVRVSLFEFRDVESKILRHEAGEIPVGEAIGFRDLRPGGRRGTPRRELGPFLVSVPRTLRDPDEPVDRSSPISGAHCSRKADARFPCFSRYMAVSASATKSSSRILSLSS